MPYDAEKARALERDDVPLLGVKERLRYSTGQRTVVVSRSRKDELIFILGVLSLIGMAVWIMFVDTGGLPPWFAYVIGTLLILIAVGLAAFLLWSPNIVLDKLKGLVMIRTWRFLGVNYLVFERGEIEAFELFEDRASDSEGRAVSEPFYYYIYLATRDGVRVPLMRFYESGGVKEFKEHFATPSGVPLLEPEMSGEARDQFST
jgi:hypothetical protein